MTNKLFVKFPSALVLYPQSRWMSRFWTYYQYKHTPKNVFIWQYTAREVGSKNIHSTPTTRGTSNADLPIQTMHAICHIWENRLLFLSHYDARRTYGWCVIFFCLLQEIIIHKCKIYGVFLYVPEEFLWCMHHWSGFVYLYGVKLFIHTQSALYLHQHNIIQINPTHPGRHSGLYNSIPFSMG